MVRSPSLPPAVMLFIQPLMSMGYANQGRMFMYNDVNTEKPLSTLFVEKLQELVGARIETIIFVHFV